MPLVTEFNPLIPADGPVCTLCMSFKHLKCVEVFKTSGFFRTGRGIYILCTLSTRSQNCAPLIYLLIRYRGQPLPILFYQYLSLHMYIYKRFEKCGSFVQSHPHEPSNFSPKRWLIDKRNCRQFRTTVIMEKRGSEPENACSCTGSSASTTLLRCALVFLPCVGLLFE